MSLRDGLKSTGRKGVFFREHSTRRHGVRKDRLFVLRYTIGGRTRTEALGWLSEGFSEIDAEQKVAELRANAKNGTGPNCLAEEKERAERERRVVEEAAVLAAERNRTFDELAKEYVSGLKLRAKTIRSYKDFLAVAGDYKPGKGIPKLGQTIVSEIPKRYLAQCIEEVARKSPSVAVAVRSALGAFYSWLAEPSREYVEGNPIPAIPKPKANIPRERTLTDSEIVTVWKAIGDAPLERLLKFLLLTGVRLGEALGMDRNEIDESTGWWTIPGSRTKGKRAHRVYLTKTAKDVLPEGPRPFHNWVKAKGGEGQVLQPFSLAAPNHVLRRAQWYGVAKFTAHDLRRTIGSGMALLGFTSDTIAAVLSHKLPGVTQAHYLHHNQDAEKKRAWLAWERHIKKITTGETAKLVTLSVRR